MKLNSDRGDGSRITTVEGGNRTPPGCQGHTMKSVVVGRQYVGTYDQTNRTSTTIVIRHNRWKACHLYRSLIQLVECSVKFNKSCECPKRNREKQEATRLHLCGSSRHLEWPSIYMRIDLFSRRPTLAHDYKSPTGAMKRGYDRGPI